MMVQTMNWQRTTNEQNPNRAAMKRTMPKNELSPATQLSAYALSCLHNLLHRLVLVQCGFLVSQSLEHNELQHRNTCHHCY